MGKQSLATPSVAFIVDLRPPWRHQVHGLTDAMGDCFCEAASMCLHHSNHSSPAVLRLEHSGTSARVPVEWVAPNAQVQAAHADMQYATEWGAYAVASLVAPNVTGLRVVERAVKGTGADWWLGTGSGLPFQDAVRLEVSGILADPAAVQRRVSEKAAQVRAGKGTLPAYVAVVEFSVPHVVIERVA